MDEKKIAAVIATVARTNGMEKGALISALFLFQMLHPLDVHSVRPVDIAQEDHRETALHRVFHLDQLILV